MRDLSKTRKRGKVTWEDVERFVQEEDRKMDLKELYTSKPWLKFYPDDVPPTVKTPELAVPELLDQTAEKYKKKTALIFYGKKISYKAVSYTHLRAHET